MSKTIILCKPFGNIKSHSMCLNDDDKATITPLIYFKKSSFLTDTEYDKLMAAFQVQLTKQYIPEIITDGEVI